MVVFFFNTLDITAAEKTGAEDRCRHGSEAVDRRYVDTPNRLCMINNLSIANGGLSTAVAKSVDKSGSSLSTVAQPKSRVCSICRQAHWELSTVTDSGSFLIGL